MLQWDGTADDGVTILPDGTYEPVIRFTGDHRTITLPNPIVLDTVPPSVTHVPHRVYTHISPDGDHRNDVFRVPYVLSEPAHAVLLVGSRQAGFTKSLKERGVLKWGGTVDGVLQPPGQLRPLDRRPGRRREPLEALPLRGRHDPLHRPRPDGDLGDPQPALRRLRPHRCEEHQLALRPRPRHPTVAHAPPARAAEARHLQPVRHRLGSHRQGDRDRRMSADVVRLGGLVGALGLAAPARRPDAALARRRARGLGRRVRAPRARARPVGTPPSLRRRRGGGRDRRRARRLALHPGSLDAAGGGARLRAGADPGVGRCDEGEPAAAAVPRRRRRGGRARRRDRLPRALREVACRQDLRAARPARRRAGCAGPVRRTASAPCSARSPGPPRS